MEKATQLVMSLVLLAAASASKPARAEPAWLEDLSQKLEPPTKLSHNEQVECTYRILDAINRHFHTEFAPDDVVPVQLPGWEQPESGFVRGGGFNIHVRGALTSPDRKHKIHPGRFGRFWDWLTLGLHPSLHIPQEIDGVIVFETDLRHDYPAQVDFVAHLDSADPYFPFGFVFHEIVDVAGAATRDPCPREY